MNRKQLAVVVGVIGSLFAGSAWAERPDKDWKKWFGHIGGGFSAPTGETEKVLDSGWNFNGGATYWPEEWPVGLALELGYNSFDIKNEVVQEIEDATSGGVDVWSVTADFLWSPRTTGTVGVNILGGIGGYYSRYDLGRPGTWSGVGCWWGWCRPVAGTGTIIVDSGSTTDFGFNLGAALTFNVGLGSQIYIEAKYHRVQTENEAEEYIPIIVGYRW